MEARAPAVATPAHELHSIWVGEFMQGFFLALRDRGIAHCILHNYEFFPRPRSGTSDMDVLVDESRWSDVLSELRRVVAERGLRVLLSYPNTSGNLLQVFVAGSEGPALHLDLLTGLVWRQCDLIDARLLLANVRVDPHPPRPRPGHEAAFSLLAYLFHRGVVKPEYRSHIARLVASDRSAFVDFIAAVWSPAQGEELAEQVVSERWEAVVDWRKRAAASLRRRSWLLQPVPTLARALVRLRNVVRRVLHPPGLWIALIGSPECGKTTLHAALSTALASIFAPEKSDLAPWPAGPWRTRLRILLRLWRNGLVVSDRESWRGAHAPLWRSSLAEKLLAQPDLVFYLDPCAEAEPTREARVARKGSRARVVNAQRPALEIANDLREQVFEHLTRREQRHASHFAEDPAVRVRM
jgi:hypothetical protein